MSSAGIPIYVTAGRNGGIRFLDGHILDKTFFSSGRKTGNLISHTKPFRRTIS